MRASAWSCACVMKKSLPLFGPLSHSPDGTVVLWGFELLRPDAAGGAGVMVDVTLV